MIVVKDAKIAESKKLAATVGFFDGVHLGHRFLVEELKQIACQEGLRSAVITFPEHPRAVLQSDYQPKLLNTFDEKLSCLASTGVDACVVLDFTPQLACLTAQEFISDVLAARLHVSSSESSLMSVLARCHTFSSSYTWAFRGERVSLSMKVM